MRLFLYGRSRDDNSGSAFLRLAIEQNIFQDREPPEVVYVNRISGDRLWAFLYDSTYETNGPAVREILLREWRRRVQVNYRLIRGDFGCLID